MSAPAPGDGRPNPDRLLARLEREETRSNRAKLKVFFGFAPGVGKTYAMLQTAHRLRLEGTDVVVGYVETHGRSETQKLLTGLETLPRRHVDYRGTTLQDFDIEAALARRPKIVLVDELPHTNAPEGRHTKRWQDVLDLLEAGIDVHTTLNVQHLESLNDVVAQITGVVVRETVPDAVIERADEIELVDISLEELLERLHEGKVYGAEQADRASKAFFGYGNLLALRELALRRTADRVDDEVRSYREIHDITRSWGTNERLLIAVGPAPGSARLVRAAKRMATRLKATWVAAYAEPTAMKPMRRADRDRLEANLRLAESLGAEIVRLTGATVSESLLEYARRHDVTRIILGKPTHARVHDLYRGSLLDEVVRGSGGIDVLVISGDDEGPQPATDASERRSTLWSPVAKRWPGYVAGLVFVAAATAIGSVLGGVVDSADVVMLYLLAIIVTAVSFTRSAAVAIAAMSVIAYDFFFVPPVYALSVTDARHTLTFAMMFGIGATVSTLMQRLRRQELDARAREERTASLYLLSRSLGAAARANDIADVVATQVSAIFQCGVAVLLPDGASMSVAAHARDIVLGAQELSVARWTLDHGRPAGHGTDTLPGTRIACFPLTSSRVNGVLALAPPHTVTVEERHFINVLAGQVATAIERVMLAEEARNAALRARTEELRSALLSTVSHDLRTPLAVITGAATILRDESVELPRSERHEFIDSICEEARRMERLVGNLLDMTRLESGIDIKRDWVPLEELLGAAASQLDAQLEGRPMNVAIADDVPLVAVDAVLFQQVFVNLFENIIKYTPAGSGSDVSARLREPEHDAVVVEVADHGPGFASNDTAQLFEKFVRGPHGGAPGVGLGLAIVRGIVVAHGGAIEAQNRPGGGALIRFTIPVSGDAPAVPLERTP